MFDVQRRIGTYTMTILSLAALWVAGMISSFDGASEKNMQLFIFGTIYFISLLFSDMYWRFVLSKGKIEEAYEKVKEKAMMLFKKDDASQKKDNDKHS